MLKTQSTLFVVDDDAVVRDALVLSLSTRGLQVVSFSSAEAFLEQYQPVESGCLILDVRLGGMSGLDLQEALAARHIDLPIIFITGHGDMQASVRAIKRGAVDFLEKPFTTDVLLQRIEEALAEQANKTVRGAEQSDTLRRIASLTPRQKDVLAQFIAHPAHSNKEIARHFSVSSRTIEHHRAQILSKMNAHSIADLVTMTRDLNLDQKFDLNET